MSGRKSFLRGALLAGLVAAIALPASGDPNLGTGTVRWADASFDDGTSSGGVSGAIWEDGQAFACAWIERPGIGRADFGCGPIDVVIVDPLLRGAELRGTIASETYDMATWQPLGSSRITVGLSVTGSGGYEPSAYQVLAVDPAGAAVIAGASTTRPGEAAGFLTSSGICWTGRKPRASCSPTVRIDRSDPASLGSAAGLFAGEWSEEEGD